MPASCHCCELLLSHAIIQRVFDVFHPSKRIPMLVSERTKLLSALNWCSDALAPHGVPASTLIRQAVPALTLFHVATQAIGTKAEKREVDAAIEDLKTQLQKVYPVHPAPAPFTSDLWVAAASGARSCGQKKVAIIYSSGILRKHFLLQTPARERCPLFLVDGL
jgi:hypothetical protein